MKTFSQTLIDDLDENLRELSRDHNAPLQYAVHALKLMIRTLEKLKSFFIEYEFESKAEEIWFFREVKPHFASKLIYFNDLYNIETNKPLDTIKALRKYYNAELIKLQEFFKENQEFYRYYRTGNRSLDKKYFIRGKYDIRLTLDSFYLQADHRFSTSHDYKVAKILANGLLKEFLEQQLAALENKPSSPAIHVASPQRWTGSKVALTELIYALHTEGAFNDGKSDLKEVVAFIESVFSINLGQYHRTFLEIRERKSERTKFLSQLKEKLMTRMDIADNS